MVQPFDPHAFFAQHGYYPQAPPAHPGMAQMVAAQIQSQLLAGAQAASLIPQLKLVPGFLGISVMVGQPLILFYFNHDPGHDPVYHLAGSLPPGFQYRIVVDATSTIR